MNNDIIVSPDNISFIFLLPVGLTPFLVFQIGTEENSERFMLNLHSIQCISKLKKNNEFHIILQIDLKGNNHLLHSCLVPDINLDMQTPLLLMFSTQDEAGKRLAELFF
ncbi:MAG: hypothetical protein WBA93_24955 [Microcoleaceae cyanobacterium]